MHIEEQAIDPTCRIKTVLSRTRHDLQCYVSGLDDLPSIFSSINSGFVVVGHSDWKVRSLITLKIIEREELQEYAAGWRRLKFDMDKDSNQKRRLIVTAHVLRGRQNPQKQIENIAPTLADTVLSSCEHCHKFYAFYEKVKNLLSGI